MRSFTFAKFKAPCPSCTEALNDMFNDDHLTEWHQRGILHEDPNSLMESANRGCAICDECRNWLISKCPTLEHVEEYFPVTCQKSDANYAKLPYWFQVTVVYGFHREYFRVFVEITETLDTERQGGLMCQYHLLPQLKPTVGTYIFPDSPPPSTKDHAVTALTQHWLEQCITGHERCNAVVAEPWAPTRLVYIGGEDQHHVRLICSQTAAPEQYATLSHVWGDHVPVKTLTDTLEAFLQVIPVATLPKTFTDAIDVARSYNLDYLWIDSLCIIQDSVEDWEREAGAMNKVYRHAFLNIAATGASNPSQGCFQERNPDAILPTIVTLKSKSEHGPGADLILAAHVVPTQFWAEFDLQPLQQRAWVFQERFLSPRILHYGRNQVSWECQTLFACEAYPGGAPKTLREAQENVRDHLSQHDFSVGPLPWDLEPTSQPGLFIRHVPDFWFDKWDDIVKLYSLRHLTFARDKLPALAGLAQAFPIVKHGKEHNEYLAGMWRAALPLRLLWKPHERTDYGLPRRYETYVAPSWSWACINGGVHQRMIVEPKKAADSLSDFRICADVEAVQVSPVVEDDAGESLGLVAFGAIKSGWLKLRGPLVHCLWDPGRGPRVEYTDPALLALGTCVFLNREQANRVENKAQIHIWFDTSSKDQPGELALLSIAWSVDFVPAFYGLVLLKHGDTGTFSRVGVFRSGCETGEAFIRTAPFQTITLI